MGTLKMSGKEVKRVEVLMLVKNKNLSLTKAAEVLGLGRGGFTSELWASMSGAVRLGPPISAAANVRGHQRS